MIGVFKVNTHVIIFSRIEKANLIVSAYFYSPAFRPPHFVFIAYLPACDLIGQEAENKKRLIFFCAFMLI